MGKSLLKNLRLADDWHFFDLRGAHYAIHGESLDAIKLSDECRTCLDRFSPRGQNRSLVSNQESLPDESALAELWEFGILRLAEETRPPSAKPHETGKGQRPDKPVISTVDLHVTNACNLACRYCYGALGEGYLNRPETMTEETARRSVDFLLEHSHPIKPSVIVFFGGEPLLNFDVIKKTVAYAREKFEAAGKRIEFSITTNATIANEEMCRYLAENRITVMISLDGPEEIHDRLRPLRRGGSCYQEMLPGIHNILSQSKVSVTSRATIGEENSDVVDVIKHARGLGFHQTVTSLEYDAGNHRFTLPVDRVRKAWLDLADYVLRTHEDGAPFLADNFRHHMQTLLFSEKKIHACGAGRNYLAISPQGSLYPCHRFMDDENFRIGTIYEGIDSDAQSLFYGNNIIEREECRQCWARYLCRGGCPHGQEHRDGKFFSKQDCEIYKTQLEIAIYLTLELESRFPQTIDDLVARVQKSYKEYAEAVAKSQKEEKDTRIPALQGSGNARSA